MINIQKYITYLLVLLLIGYAYCIISDPYPLTIREGAALAPLYLMQKGLNPFELTNLPEYNNSYVFLQQYISFPVIRLFGLSLGVLRILGHLFILVSCIIMFFSFRKLSGNNRISFLMTVIFYAACLYLNTPESRADAYGLFFYTTAISSYILFNNRAYKTAIVIILSLLGLFTKYYFVAGWAIVFAYELMIFSRKRLLIFIALSVFMSGISALIISKCLPQYFPNFLQPFLVSGGIYEKELLFSFQQLIVFLILLSPILVGLIGILGKRLFTDLPLTVIFSGKKIWDISDLKKTESYLILGSIASTAGTILFLATNIGNQMTYLFHLMLPWYLFYAVFLFKKYGIPEKKFYWMGLISCMFFALLLRPWNYFTKSKGDWKKVYNYINKHQQVFASPVFADYIIRSDKALYNSGHTEFFQATSDFRDHFEKHTREDSVLIKNVNHAVLLASKNYHKRIDENLKSKKFDLVILDNTASIGNYYINSIKNNYNKVDSAVIYLPHSRHSINVSLYLAK